MRFRACLLVVALSLFGTATAASSGGREQRVAAVLKRREADTRNRAEVLGELVRLGSDCIPVWRQWLVGEDLEEVFLEEGECHPERWVVAPDALGDLALAVLLALPLEPVMADLERAILRSGPDVGDRLAALRVLAGLGRARGLDLLWEMVARLEEDALQQPRYRVAFTQALASILTHDGEAWPAVERRLRKPDALEVGLLIASLESIARAEAHGLALSLLTPERDASERLTLLCTVARIEREQPWRVESLLVARIEREWPRLGASERAAALELLGQSDDANAFEQLSTRLNDPDAGLARAAGKALAELTGVDHGRDLALWERWRTRELEWARASFEPLLAALDGGSGTAATALAELAAHPFHRRTIARRVGARLADLEPHTQELCAEFLLGLDTRAGWAAVYRLAHDSEHADLALRLRARLVQLGGEALWSAATAGA